MKTENVVGTIIKKEKENIVQAIASMIRQSSEANQLLSESEILRRVADQHLLTLQPADLANEVGNIIKKAVDGSDDLRQISARDGSWRYYSSHSMSEAYVLILLQKEGDPLRLIAENVRQNSAVYPRPVPLDIFRDPPFDLTRQKILSYLEQMAADEEYRDIATTTTSASRVFLYSTLHLEPEYAFMLAEWLDVGQFDNP